LLEDSSFTPLVLNRFSSDTSFSMNHYVDQCTTYLENHSLLADFQGEVSLLTSSPSATAIPEDLFADNHLKLYLEQVTRIGSNETVQSRKVKDLPDEHELSWFMVCGTTDYMCTYPCYQVFTDSLDFYGIGYDYNYFEGGHVWDPESWIIAVHWIDSIINLEYQTVGVEIIEQPINYISVYPNPASDELTVNYQLEKSAVVNIYLIDLQGKQHVVLHNETNAMGIQTESMDISHLPPGVYFLRLQAGNNVVTKKIIKVH